MVQPRAKERAAKWRWTDVVAGLSRAGIQEEQRARIWGRQADRTKQGRDP